MKRYDEGRESKCIWWGCYTNDLPYSINFEWGCRGEEERKRSNSYTTLFQFPIMSFLNLEVVKKNEGKKQKEGRDGWLEFTIYDYFKNQNIRRERQWMRRKIQA